MPDIHTDAFMEETLQKSPQASLLYTSDEKAGLLSSLRTKPYGVPTVSGVPGANGQVLCTTR